MDKDTDKLIKRSEDLKDAIDPNKDYQDELTELLEIERQLTLMEG